MTEKIEVTCDGWDNTECAGTPYCPPRCPRYIDAEGIAYNVRLFEPEDLDSLVNMYETIESESRTRGLPPTSRSAIETWLEDLIDRGWNLVARHQNRVIGHVAVVPTNTEEPKFVIFVHQDYQNRGLGTEVVKHMVAYAADRDYDALALSVSRGNQQAITVYRNIGFELEGDQLLTGDRDLDMRLPLSAPIADQVRLPPAER